MTTPRLQVLRISKQFLGVRALDAVSLAVAAGEVLAVVGENGAGKSTLMKILAGIERPDAGEIRLEGSAVTVRSVRHAQQLGIALIHQELNLAENLSVLANIWLGREQRRGWFINDRASRAATSGLMDQMRLNIPLDLPVHRLSAGRQQMVEIMKALSLSARILIMDEPTSSLSEHEAQALFAVIRTLKQRGTAVIYISHRLREVQELADRVVVLRDGRNAGELLKSEISHDRLVQLMVGRDFRWGGHRRTAPDPGPAALEVRAVRTAAYPGRAVSLRVNAGEIVGIAGLIGAGRTELLEALFGVAPRLGGEVVVAGAALASASPKAAIEAGMAFVPEDRKLQGLILEMSVRENLSLAALARCSRMGFLSSKGEGQLSGNLVQKLNIRPATDSLAVQYLSGGNQQKVALGKWLATRPRVLLLDEPTRGIDVAAKQEIYAWLEKLAADGVAILFVSSELEEILRLSQRTLVVHQGRIAGELSAERASEESIMALATGAQVA